MPEVFNILSRREIPRSYFERLGTLITQRIDAQRIASAQKITEKYGVKFTPDLQQDMMCFLRHFCSSEVEDHCKETDDLEKHLEAYSKDLKKHERGKFLAMWGIEIVVNNMESERKRLLFHEMVDQWQCWRFTGVDCFPRLYWRGSVDKWIEMLRNDEGKALKATVKAINKLDEAAVSFQT